jgi:hypothetical protein
MQGGLTLRRAHRDDFARVRALLGAPASDARRERKRFRRLVSTLREDLYVAEREGDPRLAGLVLVAYVRGLGPATAIVRELRGDPEVTSALLASVERHAAARGCARIEVQVDAELDASWERGVHLRHRTVSS